MKLSKPSFCYIAPTSYLPIIEHASNTHLVLAHLIDRDEKYTEFYARMSKRGDFIICDNSAYELKEPYKPDRLVQLAKRVDATALVLPDFPFEHSSKTIEAAEQYIPIFKQAGLKTMFVPQSQRGDIEDWIQCYQWACKNDDIDIIGISILGVPNAIPDINPAFARVVMMQVLKDRGLYCGNKHHHFLGLNAGPRLEIPSLLKMGVLDTVDSSGPVWSAILGHEYSKNTDSLLMTTKPKLPVNFSIPRTNDVQTLIRIHHNITLTNDLFEYTDSADDVWYAQE